MQHVYTVGTLKKTHASPWSLMCVFLRNQGSLRRLEGCVIRKKSHNKASDGTFVYTGGSCLFTNLRESGRVGEKV